MSADRRSNWPALMARAQAGEQRAYAQLLTEIAPAVLAFVRRKIADPTLAEDVVQDVLLTVHRIRHTYDPARPFLPWLATIAFARSIDALRRRGRRDGREVHDDLALVLQADPSAGDQAEAAGDVAALLAALPPRQRHVVELVKLREMSLAEASVTTSLSVSALKALLHRALVTMRGRAEERR